MKHAWKLIILTMTVTLLLIVSSSLLAQDETDTNTPPAIVSITPAQATIQGTGVVIVQVTYADPDTDAVEFDWSMTSTDMQYYDLPSGFFDQSIVGETIPVPFVCNGSPYTAEMALEVVDYYGNRSAPATFTLTCEAPVEAVIEITATPEVTPAVPTATPEPVNTNTAPTIVSIEPGDATLDGADAVTVNVTYADPDNDAAYFIWDMVETDALTWELPDGQFSQSAIGTTIPVTFYCTHPTFKASIQLIVEDANGNQSEPSVFDLSCE